MTKKFVKIDKKTENGLTLMWKYDIKQTGKMTRQSHFLYFFFIKTF